MIVIITNKVNNFKWNCKITYRFSNFYTTPKIIIITKVILYSTEDNPVISKLDRAL